MYNPSRAEISVHSKFVTPVENRESRHLFPNLKKQDLKKDKVEKCVSLKLK